MIHRKRKYKSVDGMIAGLRNGELLAATELADILFEATRSEKSVDGVLTIVLALLPAKTRKKMLKRDADQPSWARIQEQRAKARH